MRWQRLWPVLLVILALAAAYGLGLQRTLSFAYLGEQRQFLQALVAARPAAAALGYGLLYALAVALSLPGATVLTMAGGLLFGTLAGAAVAVLGATLGAVLLFLAARHAVGDWLAARAGPMMNRIRPGLERDGFSYLLALRLLPLFPFWLVNLAPALVRMRLGTFALATLIGIIPGTLVFASVGAGIGSVLDEGRQPDLSIILRPAVLLPLIGLALLALLPVAWRRWKASHG
ncbi:TVP38/TMEM64 family protein [Teichococcus vastitatis]|jgi:uncharacterized membrane protein YdjX (TVP38/TMEM64 family)|uniref:TVP38/TMEM64 family membrane protein n=1 Tax=Teichococcus vastitatis TaxID=2307076 RepID=A0ABS9W716_9PROT|nr:VTT domain-containing protein [Pseudoroseomonas vastitatis]MCI0755091.1 VTT domain-containing protein [Pseudoroseomonas vastitatis]